MPEDQQSSILIEATEEDDAKRKNLSRNLTAWKRRKKFSQFWENRPPTQNPTSIASSHRDWTLRSAFLRRFHFKGRNFAPDSGATTFWALQFPSFPLIFCEGVDELESLPAFLTLKFISGHTLLLEFADS